jgi:hypothetical protein
MPRNNSKLLGRPSNELVKKYHEDFINNSQSLTNENTLKCLFKKYPQNVIIEEVIIKVCAINSLYNTNIFSVNSIASNIKNINNFDERIKTFDKELVHEIAQTNNRYFYSFATKYCHFHNDIYPIYDSFVNEILINYQLKENFIIVNRNVEKPNTKKQLQQYIRDYNNFFDLYEAFKIKYHLETFSNEEIDHFLWGYGKVLYPKNY